MVNVFKGDASHLETRESLTKFLIVEVWSCVSAGEIYVGAEKTRLVKKLAKIKKEQRHIAEVVDLIQEIAVETLGTMTKTKGTTFILGQVNCA